MSTNTVGPGILRYTRWPLVRYGLLITAISASTLLMWPGLLRNIFSEAFVPHGSCLLWKPELLWLHVISDSAIGASYVAISFTLAWLVHRARKDIPFQWVFLAFGLFIIACGSTHFMEVVTLWKPFYWLSGDVKLITAIASVATAVVLPPLVPKTLGMIREAKLSEERKVRIEAQNRELEDMTIRLKELDLLKTQLFANVSHELRTPLALTLGRTEKLLNSETLSPQQRRELEVVHRNARSLLKQVNDLLDISKLESGHMGLNYSEIDLARIVRRAVANFDSLASDRGIQYSYRGMESLAAQVDYEKFERILLNLLSNAFKFTPDGGVVSCEVHTEGDSAVITVSDSGPGIPVEQREAVFERFRQLDGGTTRRFGGTGLGLAIVRDFVELHHGSVHVDAAAEGGARFIVKLPLRAPEGSQISSTPVQTGKETLDEAVEDSRPLASQTADDDRRDLDDAQASAPLVLIVEDNAEMNDFIVESLAGEYRVASAFDGKEGMEKALAFGPDVIVSDIMMPEFSGEDMLREVRSHPELEGTPVILLTAKADQGARVRVLQQGAQDYIMKPFSVGELRARVRNLASINRTRKLLRQELNSQTHDVQELAREVTERKRELHSALDALQASESRFRRLVESNILGVITADLRGCIRDANDAFLQMVGRTRQDLDAGLLDWREMTPREYLGADAAALRQIADSGVARPYEKAFVARDGRRIPVLVGAAKLEGEVDASIAFVLDLTERKRAEAANAKLAAIVESSDDAIIGKTLDGRITSWNAGAERIYGYRAAEVIGEPVSILSPPDRQDEIRLILDRLARGERIEHLETVRQTKDGRRITVSISISLMRSASGQVIGASTIARDITDIRRAEEALRNSEKHATVGRLAATMAHEINNPLEAVSNVLYLLATKPNLDEEARQYISIAGQEMDRISHIVKQTLGFYRESPSPVSVNLPELIDSVIGLYSRKIQDKELRVRRHFEEVADVPAYPAEMRQVFSNLIINAIEASRNGGDIIISVRASRDWSDSSRCGVRALVCDNGSGIDPEHRRNLFEPFFTTKGEKGTGLGLWVSNGIVQKHGGSIRVRSSVRPERSGTCFAVFMPSEFVGTRDDGRARLRQTESSSGGSAER